MYPLVSVKGYTVYRLRECISRDELFGGPVANRDACKFKCDNDNQCVSFEFVTPSMDNGDTYCRVSSSCTYELSGENDYLDLFVKGK